MASSFTRVLTFTLRVDDIPPRLSRLASEQLKEKLLMGAGTVIMTLAQRSFDEPALRPSSWLARKTKGSHPLLTKSGDLRQGIHVKRPALTPSVSDRRPSMQLISSYRAAVDVILGIHEHAQMGLTLGGLGRGAWR